MVKTCSSCYYLCKEKCTHTEGKHFKEEVGDFWYCNDYLEAYLKPIEKSENINNPIQREEVNHPSHYNQGIEAIEVIESWELNFSLGNAIKYILRAPHKGKQIQDLQKAKWYIERELERLAKNSK